MSYQFKFIKKEHPRIHFEIYSTIKKHQYTIFFEPNAIYVIQKENDLLLANIYETIYNKKLGPCIKINFLNSLNECKCILSRSSPGLLKLIIQKEREEKQVFLISYSKDIFTIKDSTNLEIIGEFERKWFEIKEGQLYIYKKLSLELQIALIITISTIVYLTKHFTPCLNSSNQIVNYQNFFYSKYLSSIIALENFVNPISIPCNISENREIKLYDTVPFCLKERTRWEYDYQSIIKTNFDDQDSIYSD